MFGDGTVVLMSTPGHTPGHQVLAVKFAHRGLVVLAGDLYHYPEERTTGRMPTFEFNAEQSKASRAKIEQFVKDNKARALDRARHRDTREAATLAVRRLRSAVGAGARRRRNKSFPRHAGRPSLGLERAHPCARTVSGRTCGGADVRLRPPRNLSMATGRARVYVERNPMRAWVPSQNGLFRCRRSGTTAPRDARDDTAGAAGDLEIAANLERAVGLRIDRERAVTDREHLRLARRRLAGRGETYSWCEPSQNGLFFDAPQRHSVARKPRSPGHRDGCPPRTA